MCLCPGQKQSVIQSCCPVRVHMPFMGLTLLSPHFKVELNCCLCNQSDEKQPNYCCLDRRGLLQVRPTWIWLRLGLKTTMIWLIWIPNKHVAQLWTQPNQGVTTSWVRQAAPNAVTNNETHTLLHTHLRQLSCLDMICTWRIAHLVTRFLLADVYRIDPCYQLPPPFPQHTPHGAAPPEQQPGLGQHLHDSIWLPVTWTQTLVVI